MENINLNNFQIKNYLFEVVKKLSMVVTPRVTLAGSAFHSIQKVTKDEVTRIIPRKCNFIDSRKCFDHT